MAAASGPIGELGRYWPQATLDSRKHVGPGIFSSAHPTWGHILSMNGLAVLINHLLRGRFP